MSAQAIPSGQPQDVYRLAKQRIRDVGSSKKAAQVFIKRANKLEKEYAENQVVLQSLRDAVITAGDEMRNIEVAGGDAAELHLDPAILIQAMAALQQASIKLDDLELSAGGKKTDPGEFVKAKRADIKTLTSRLKQPIEQKTESKIDVSAVLTRFVELQEKNSLKAIEIDGIPTEEINSLYPLFKERIDELRAGDVIDPDITVTVRALGRGIQGSGPFTFKFSAKTLLSELILQLISDHNMAAPDIFVERPEATEQWRKIDERARSWERVKTGDLLRDKLADAKGEVKLDFVDRPRDYIISAVRHANVEKVAGEILDLPEEQDKASIVKTVFGEMFDAPVEIAVDCKGNDVLAQHITSRNFMPRSNAIFVKLGASSISKPIKTGPPESEPASST